MVISGRLVLAGLLAFSLAACEPEPETKADPCIQNDPGKRALRGSYVRQSTDTPKLELLQISGSVRRNGRLSKLFVQDYEFDARIDRDAGVDGAFKAARQSKALPVELFRDVADTVVVYDPSYRQQGGAQFDGLAVTGSPTPPSQIADSGNQKLSGPIMLRFINLTEGADQSPVEFSGMAELSIQYGTKFASLTVTGLGPEAPVQTISWNNILLCGARVASAGQGGFLLADQNGAQVNFAGPTGSSPSGSAILDSRFFGASSVGLPTSVGGGILIQGDNGLISGVFVVIPVD